VPGSLLHQKLEFKAPVVLYASPNNPGAEAVAGELAGRFPNLRVCTVRRTRRSSRLGSSSVLCRRPSLKNLVPQVSSNVFSREPNLKPLWSRHGSRSSKADDPEVSPGRLSRFTGTQQTGCPQATHFLLYLNKNTFMGEDCDRLAKELEVAIVEGLQVKMAHEKDEGRFGCAFSTFFQTTPQELIDQDFTRSWPLRIGFVGSELHRFVSQKLFAKALSTVPMKLTLLESVSSPGLTLRNRDTTAVTLRNSETHVETVLMCDAIHTYAGA